MNKRDQAKELARQGFRVFPLKVGSKEPAIGKWKERASSGPEVVHRMWSEAVTGKPIEYNIAIATGSGLGVFDIDNKNGKRGAETWRRIEREIGSFPATLAVHTPNQGVHFYARDPAQRWIANSTSRLGEGVDIKGDGGYVVGPGSVIDGRAYRVAADHPIAAMPEPYAALIAAAKPDHLTRADLGLDEEAEALAAERAKQWLLDHAPLEGTYRVACRVLDFGVPIDTAVDLLLDHWNDRRHEPKTEEQLREKLEHAAQYRHRPIGADSADAEFVYVELPEEQAEQTWPVPLNLWEDPSKSNGPPDVIDGVFPPVVQGWIDDEAERKGVSRGAATTLTLGMFAGCISARAQVQVKQHDTGFKNRPTIWAMTVGGPGSGKSPIQSAIMRPLNLVERERRQAIRLP